MPRNDGAATQAEANFFVAEAHDSQITKASDRTPVNGRSERLRCVIDDANVFPGGKFCDSFDVGGIAKKVRHDDRAGFSR